MKKILVVIILLSGLNLFPASAVPPSPLEDYLKLSGSYSKTSSSDTNESLKFDSNLLRQENALSEKILNSQPLAEKLAPRVASIEHGMLVRLGAKTRYKIVQDKRNDLRFLMNQIENEERKNVERNKRWNIKPVEWKGRMLDLTLGKWVKQADGSMNWLSDIYSDITLSQAQYQELWKKAYSSK
ncbi:MAG: hypothetical protein HQM10_19425 [Candidatus Riflebacteria bacterium]|nr:hypothetical protein [Candidatus Riflebacteria bacterium]